MISGVLEDIELWLAVECEPMDTSVEGLRKKMTAGDVFAALMGGLLSGGALTALWLLVGAAVFEWLLPGLQEWLGLDFGLFGMGLGGLYLTLLPYCLWLIGRNLLLILRSRIVGRAIQQLPAADLLADLRNGGLPWSPSLLGLTTFWMMRWLTVETAGILSEHQSLQGAADAFKHPLQVYGQHGLSQQALALAAQVTDLALEAYQARGCVMDELAVARLQELLKHQVKNRATDALAAQFVQIGALLVLELEADADAVGRRLLSLARELQVPDTAVEKIASRWADFLR